MTLTAFGIIYLPILLAVVLFARQWLPALIIFSTCIQAASVFNVPVGNGAFGITPYNITALAAFCVLLVHLWQQRQLPLLPGRHLRLAFSLFAAYVAVAVIGALVLPWVFEGQMVNLLADPDGYAHHRLLPLGFTLSNPVQAANLLIHGVVLVYLLQASDRDDRLNRSLILGLFAGILLVVVLGLYERMADFLGLPRSTEFWASNPGYRQSHSSMWSGLRRIAVPFTESSYTSAFLSAVTVASLAVVAFGKHRIVAALATIICGLALVNTTGLTGMAASGFGIAAVLVWVTFRSWKVPSLRKVAALLWTGCALVAYLLHQKVPFLTTLLIDRLTLERPQMVRLAADQQALRVFSDTYGVGVGLGSNRAASFMTSLFSNTGILGGLLFVAMLGALLWGYARHKNLTDIQLFIAVGLAAAMLAMSIGVPDLNLPMFWAFIFLAFLYHPVVAKKTAEEKGFRFQGSGFRKTENQKPGAAKPPPEPFPPRHRRSPQPGSLSRSTNSRDCGRRLRISRAIC